MKFKVLLAFCLIFAVAGIKAAEDKKKSSSEKRETVAKPMTDKQKRQAEDRLRKELETPFKKWLDEDVRWIITDEERSTFSKLKTDEERENFIEQFWLRRDPTPDTEENEFKEEHYRRIAWANDRFASGLPGWRTDRGMVYIKFGPPDENDSHVGGPGNRDIEEGGGTTTFFPYEIWIYRYLDCCGSDVRIEFVDTTYTNEFHMTMDPSEKDSLARIPGAGLTLCEQQGQCSQADRFTRTDGTTLGVGNAALPSRYNQFNRLEQFANVNKAPEVKFKDLEAAINSTIKYNLLPLKVRVDYIPVMGSSIMTYVTLQFDRNDLQYKQTQGIAKSTIHVNLHVENMTRRRIGPPIEDEVNTEVPAEMLQEVTHGQAIMQKSIALAPGRYRLTVAAKDVVGGNQTIYDQALDVPRLDDDTLSASSLILADQLQAVDTKSIGQGQFVIGTTKVRPRMNETFRRDEKLGIYFQLYNFEGDVKTQKADGSVQYEIIRNGTNQKVLDFTEDLTTAAAHAVIQRLLPLQNMEPGDYTLKLKITDKRRNQVLTPSATFKVI